MEDSTSVNFIFREKRSSVFGKGFSKNKLGVYVYVDTTKTVSKKKSYSVWLQSEFLTMAPRDEEPSTPYGCSFYLCFVSIHRGQPCQLTEIIQD